MSTRGRALVALGAVALVGAPSAAAVAQDVVDGVVAVVGEQPLTLGDVQFEAEVQATLEHGGRWMHEHQPQASPEILELLVERSLLLQEAGNQPLAVDEEVLERLETFLDRFERLEDLTAWLARWTIGTVELRAHFEADIRAREFAQMRLGPAIRLSEREILESYRAQPERWQGVALEEAAPIIRAELMRARFDEHYRSWIDDIRQRRGVRITALGRMKLGAEP